jgi:hypothetical protein
LDPLHVFEQAKGAEGEDGRIVESGIDEYTTANRRVDHRKGKQTQLQAPAILSRGLAESLSGRVAVLGALS